MGLLDRFLPGGPPTYKQAPVDGVLGAWTAARTGAGLALAGGQVALTPDALVFSPWDMDETRAWLVEWLGRSFVLGILASVGTPNLSSTNNDAFADWLVKLRSTGVTVA